MGYVLALVKDGDEAELRRHGRISDDTPIILLSSIREAQKVAESLIPDAVLIERGLLVGLGLEFMSFLNSYPPRPAQIPMIVVEGRASNPRPPF